MFYGRLEELNLLDERYLSKRSELVTIYGRRRVGKSSLVETFAENNSHYYKFEGIEGENSPAQIKSFSQILSRHIDDKYISKIQFDSWNILLSYMTENLIENKKRKEKIIIFLDEIQWMAAGRSKLISIIKYFWDNYWKDMNVMLILCGSIASFMVKKIIHSKALYGRITLEILLRGLKPYESVYFFKGKRSKEEILKYLLVFGGIPKYLEEINLNKSFNQNLNNLCFSKNGYMVDEVSKIFYSQFREVQSYLSINSILKDRLCSLYEISVAIGRKSGGSVKDLIEQLVNAELVDFYISIERGWNTKFKKYRLADEYLIFYYKYIESNLQIVKKEGQSNLFEKLTSDSFTIWLGFAFERFCLKHAAYLARIMGFENEMILASPYFGRGDSNFQIDLIYKRVDNVIVLCEVKYHKGKIGTAVIPEIDKKCKLLKLPRGYTLEKALISVYGPDKSLIESEYFNYHVTLDDII